MSKIHQPNWWLVELPCTREWVEARGAIPAVVAAVSRHREDHFSTSEVDVFYATRVGVDRAVAVDADLALQRAGWAPRVVG